MSSTLFTAQLHPGRALGFLVLGASLHDILTRLKAEPQCFPRLELAYSTENPVKEPVTVNLPANGLRLRFDGPEQRLRLVEVLDFTKNHIIFKDQNTERDLVKPQTDAAGDEPTFKHIYQRFLGPTYDGEFLPSSDGQSLGVYVLSYPGVAFTFPLPESAYSPDKDVVTLLSSSTKPAASMAVFNGDSWAQGRKSLWTEVLPSIKTFAPLAKGKDVVSDEISLVKIHGGGKLQLFKRWTTNSVWISLGETTPQELVAELGPPDAIYRKNDQRMYIHQIRTASHSRTRQGGDDPRPQGDSTDTDQSSAHATSGDSDGDEAVDDDVVGNLSGECFYNYFYLGFDVLVSAPAAPSQPPPSQEQSGLPHKIIKYSSADRLVASKLILHGNVPGSYPFNRHRRCRWEIAYLDHASPDSSINTETAFTEIQKHLRTEWQSIYSSEAEAISKQRGMVLNRGWGDSPGSSIEFLGGWEDSSAHVAQGVGPKRADGTEDSTTTLYGFPGLVFEVLKNGYVSAVTVF
ncbi:hypothetical protein BD289DRAFT_363304 [Coniella lustricola]|uniref:Uncharacterized protein n=1 Tax=Coniella lustricola TaxID=2025994 RepID=A0A2T3AFD4_9PEZI|nr:hypothetical protein BD289DRAFT_363304 [Coniella lustricola]